MKNFILPFLVFFVGNFSVAQSGAIAELKLSSSVGASGTFKITVGAPGTRVELKLGSAQMPGMGINTTTISKSTEPGKSYLVNDSNKSYSVHDQVDESENETVEIVVLGNEKVGNYNCVHVRAKNNHGNSYEMWNSKEVMNYAGFAASMAREKYTGSAALQKALAQKGAEGFPVKVTYNDKEGSFTTELVSITPATPAASLFQIPTGYKETQTATMGPGMPGGMDPSQLMNMSPAEREKYIEQMKKQYGQ